jgi:tetratricopeptide (TPR) repeat protein
MMAESTEIRARLVPELANAHNGIVWQVFLGVALHGDPAESPKDAPADADKAVALAPERRNILDTRGQIHLALGRTDEAFADLEEAIAVGFNDIRPCYGRGRAHDLKGNRDAAIADYRTALSLDAENDDWEKHVQDQVQERKLDLLVAIGRGILGCAMLDRR